MAFMGRGIKLLIVGGCLTAALACASAADAASVRASWSSLRYKAARGENNRLWVYHYNGKYQFQEIGAPLSYSSPCAPGVIFGDLPVVECPDTVRRIKIKLNDGALDQVVMLTEAPERGVYIIGGRGADRIFGTSGPAYSDEYRYGDIMKGGSGDDVLVGYGGRDRYVAGSGDDQVWSADGELERVNCGSGNDSATGDTLASTGSWADLLVRCEHTLPAPPGP